MKVIWKRPDGFLGAVPADYNVIELDGHSRIWLHQKDKDSYPFRVSGGWEEGEATKKLNNLINLIPCDNKVWVDYLTNSYSHSLKDNPNEYVDGVLSWLTSLKGHLKGDTWEMEILERAIECTIKRLVESKDAFLKRVCP